MASVGVLVQGGNWDARRWLRVCLLGNLDLPCASVGHLVLPVGGAGRVYRSTSGAPNQWEYRDLLSSTTNVHIGPYGRLYVGSDFGHVYFSDDRGTTWNRSDAPTRDRVFAFWTLSAREVYAAGDHGFVGHSDDGAQTWQIQKPDDYQNYLTTRAIWASSPTYIYAVGAVAPGYLHSSDGKTWKEMPAPANRQDLYITGVWGSAANDIYMVGKDGLIAHYY